MTFGTDPKDNNQVPTSSVYVQNTSNSDLTALRGVNKQTDSNTQSSASASISYEDLVASGSIVANGGTVVLALGLGISSWSVDLRGTFNAGTTIQFEGTIDGTNFFSVFGVPIGATTDTPVSSVVGGAAVQYQGNAVGLQQFRVRASAFAGGDNVTVKIIGSVGMDGGFIDKALPPGSNTIGAIDVTDRAARLAGALSGYSGNSLASLTNGVPAALGQAATSTLTNVTAAVSDTSLLASNTNRKGAYFYNDSTAILYLEFGSAAASTTNYTLQIPAQGFYEMPTYPVYTGAIRGIWAAAAGAVRITELS